MTNPTDSLIEKLHKGVWHAAQDTEFDTGFNTALAMMRGIINQHESLRSSPMMGYPGGDLYCVKCRVVNGCDHYAATLSSSRK